MNEKFSQISVAGKNINQASRCCKFKNIFTHIQFKYSNFENLQELHNVF